MAGTTDIDMGIDALRERVRGPVLTPADEEFPGLCKVWNEMYSHRRPAVIVRATGTADVQEAITFARTNNLPFAIRAGGHSYSGASTIDGGLLLDMRLMDGVHVDPTAQTADVQGGALLGALDRECQVFGLATTTGVVTDTAVAGLTLGGGVGRLARKHGLTVDNVLAFDVVTADGAALHVDADNHPDLFWALRGGGSNFGVVTNFKFALHPIGPRVVGGFMGWPMEQMRDVMAACRTLHADAPEDYALSALLITGPPLPFVPEELVGKPMLFASVAWLGPVDEADSVLAPWREVKPAFDLVEEMTYVELQKSMDMLAPAGTGAYIKTGFLAEVDGDVLDVAERAALNASNPFDIVELSLLGGAINRVGVEDTAFPQRDAGWFFIVAALWLGEQGAEGDTARDWCRRAARDFDGVKLPGAYINFMSDSDQESLREAQAETNYDRLATVKQTYDPGDFFKLNPNAVAAT